MNVKSLKICWCVFVFLFAKTYSQSPVSSQTAGMSDDDESVFLSYSSADYDTSDFYGSGDESTLPVSTTSYFTVQPSSMKTYTGSPSTLYPSEMPATTTLSDTIRIMTPTSQFTPYQTSSPITSSTTKFTTTSTTSTLDAATATTDCSTPSVANGVHVGSTADGSEVSVKCKEGFVNSGAETMTCKSGQWSNNASCLAATRDDWPFVTGLAVGIPLFVLFCVFLCCCCWCCCLARRRRRRRPPPSDDSSSVEEDVFVFRTIPVRYVPVALIQPFYGTSYTESRLGRRAWPSAETWTYADSVVSDNETVDSMDVSIYRGPTNFEQSRQTH